MNHCVPDFELDEDYPIPTSSGFARTKKSPMADEEIMELLWQNGHVVVQSQNQRPLKRSHIGDSAIQAEKSAAREVQSEEESTNHLFIQEDEMASWLHYPIDDLYADLLYPAPSAPVATPSCSTPISEVRLPEVRPPPSVAAVARPPIHPARFQNFMHFTRPKGRLESGPSGSNKAVTSTVADSSETPVVGPKPKFSHLADSAVQVQVAGANVRCDTMSGAPAVGTSSATCELTVTSSPGGSGASASAEPVHKPQPQPMEDRKRKGKEADDSVSECQSEDVEFESPDAKKQVRGSTKKSRAAEVHNLSERRRRDRINEKMKALQELIPRCNKSDKASMLDEAIEYLKSLQLQVQMMSMGCGMVPMMFPGVQHYMPPMGMGIGMGMNRPMVPFPSVLAGSALPTPTSAAAAAAGHLGPRFPLPAFHMPPIPLPGPSRIRPPSQSEPRLNSLGAQNSNQSRIPNFPDPYQQYLSLQQMQVPVSQSQSMVQPSTSKPSSSRGVENFENHQSGKPTNHTTVWIQNG